MFCILSITVLYQICLLKIFSLGQWLSYSPDIVFCKTEFFIVIKYSLSNIYFMDCVFGTMSKKSLPYI